MDINSKAIKILVLIFAACASAMKCDPEREYTVENKISGKTIRCLDCNDCKPGLELKVPCGSTIGIYESVGECQKCKDGYFSEESSVRPCQKCLNCLDNEIILGACNCTGHCKKGFVMTNKGLCEPSQQTSEDPALVKSGLSIAETVLIVVGALFPIPIVCVLCCLCKRNKNNCQQKLCKGFSKNEKNISPSTCASLLNEGKIMHQECPNNGLPASNGPHVPESTGGFVMTSQTSCV